MPPAIDDDGDVLIDLAEIDLGEIDLAESVSWLGVPRSGRRSRGVASAAVIAAMGLAGLFALVAIIPTKVPLWTYRAGPGSSLAAGPDAVYVVRRGGAPAIDALDAATGRRMWRLDLPSAPFRLTDIGAGTDAVWLHTRELFGVDSAQVDATGELTVLVEHSSGRVLAQRSGLAQRRIGDLALFERRGGSCENPSLGCVEVAAVNLVTGLDAWRLPLPFGGRLLAGWANGPAHFATATPDGSITVRDVSTGGVVARTTSAAVGGVTVRLSAFVGPVLVVGRASTESTKLLGYRAADLTPLWSAAVARDPGARFADVGLVDLHACGTYLCLDDGGGSAVIDPASGALRLRTDLTVMSQLGSGVLVASWYGRAPPAGMLSEVTTIDPTSGAVVTRLPNTLLADVAPDSTAGPAVVMTPSVAQTQFAVIGSRGVVTRSFAVERVDLRCVASRQVLACIDPHGDVVGYTSSI